MARTYGRQSYARLVQVFWKPYGHIQSNNVITKAIIDKRKVRRFHTVVEMVRSYSLKTVLRTLDNGEIIPKLGNTPLIKVLLW